MQDLFADHLGIAIKYRRIRPFHPDRLDLAQPDVVGLHFARPDKWFRQPEQCHSRWNRLFLLRRYYNGRNEKILSHHLSVEITGTAWCPLFHLSANDWQR